ncbi:MAG: hypothetical protein ACI97A_001977 [Planctomycetota bacterium]|jgi:hypothetical protein
MKEESMKPDTQVTCKSHIQSWERGDHSDEALLHIENCAECSRVIQEGAPEIHTGPEEPPTELLLTPKTSRRRFFLRCSLVGLGLLGVSYFGLKT